MTIYAIGDIQGCAQALYSLLDKIGFNPDHDILWCAGDLVNRGPDSLAVLRYLRELGDACICVLGNHDLHLLAMAAGVKNIFSDDLQVVLQAHDATELLNWLRSQPLLYVDYPLGWCMVHAGLHPQWSLQKHCAEAAKIEQYLRGDHWQEFIHQLYNRPLATNLSTKIDGIATFAPLVFATSVFTRTRYCTANGNFCWQAHAQAPPQFAAWFVHKKAAWRAAPVRIVYGHWATKGLVSDQVHVLGLDSGCVWGGCLSVAKLDNSPISDIQLQSVVCQQYQVYASHS